MKDSTVLAGIGIAALAAIEIAALTQGIDSVVLGGVVAVIAGLAGYEIKAWREKK